MKVEDVILKNGIFVNLVDPDGNKNSEPIEDLTHVIIFDKMDRSRSIGIAAWSIILFVISMSIQFPLILLYWAWEIWYTFKSRNKVFLGLVFKNKKGAIERRVYFCNQDDRDKISAKFAELKEKVNDYENLRVSFREVRDPSEIEDYSLM